MCTINLYCTLEVYSKHFYLVLRNGVEYEKVNYNNNIVNFMLWMCW